MTIIEGLKYSPLTQAKDAAVHEASRQQELAKHKKNAMTRFNGNPQLGLEYLRALGLWDGAPEGLAVWLDEGLGQGVSKRRAGEFLGSDHAAAGPAFDAFLRLMGPALGPGVRLDTALRMLLRRFRLPGEAQCIDRIVERFARAFKEANPPGSAAAWSYSEDAAYVLSFSLVMLNTDLHSPSIQDRHRMTKEAFIANNRGVDGGSDLPRPLLEELYDSVQGEEVVMDEGDLFEAEAVRYAGARRAGWLEKGRGTCPGWHRLWFILADGCLYSFGAPSDADTEDRPPRAIVPLRQGLEIRLPLGAAPGRTFYLAARSGGPIKAAKRSVRGPHFGKATIVRLRACDSLGARAWIDALRAEGAVLPAGGVAKMSGRDRQALCFARQASSHAPLYQGWLRKRGELNLVWKRRYFALYSGVTCVEFEGEAPPHEPVLMYFKSEEKFRKLVDYAKGCPYQGAVRLGTVTELKRQSGANQDCACLTLVTGDRTWLLAPDDGGTDLSAWWFALEGACHAAQ
mmetsp:Transcript_4390/g.12979  ORF Transcript_4390/g.12979 Transcript_4390/m.12979 type:complete len:513 (+) Transcript_4390:1792-3330(+)